MQTTSRDLPLLSREALRQPDLQRSLEGVRRAMPGLRAAALSQLEDYPAMRSRAGEIRARSLASLDELLLRFEEKAVEAGGLVHWAATSEEACRVVTEICKSVGARTVIKSKSMVTEEIALNEALERSGFVVTETDLGEYIIQLRHERPSHILAPALHLRLEQIGRTFEEHHVRRRDHPLTDPDEMLREARSELRQVFLQGDVGITGANILVAESGSAIIVSNEGNADLVSSLPDTHIVVTGIEKAVATLEDAGVLLRLLARSAVGESLSSYTTFVQGARRADDRSGPRKFHVVLVDNGRTRLLGSASREMLRCIRCSACLNHCPVYTSIGGHAYGSVYSGPMGSVLTPWLAGLPNAHHLPQASTLCGRCAEVCPVGIPIPDLLRAHRQRAFESHVTPWSVRFGLRAWALLNRSPVAIAFATRWVGRVVRLFGTRAGLAPGQWLRRAIGPAGKFTLGRDLRLPAKLSFQARWKARRRMEHE
jgi:L-lactate dehydrogenase complex protein LldF